MTCFRRMLRYALLMLSHRSIRYVVTCITMYVSTPIVKIEELIGVTKTSLREKLKGIDFAAYSELREKEASISQTEELDNLFTINDE